VSAIAHAVPRSASTRRATVAGSVGNLVEWYDFAVIAASATLLAQHFSPPGGDGLVFVYVLLATSTTLRMVGALVIGRRADRRGRRPSFIAMLVLMAVATGAVGLLPTWQMAGVLAAVALLVLRAGQAFSSGGEIASSVPFIVEHAPPGRAGRQGAWHMATVCLGLTAGFAIVAALALVPGATDPTSWLWRVPFLLAFPLGAVAVLLRVRGTESPEFLQHVADEGARPPARLRIGLGGQRRQVLLGFAVAASFTCSFTVWFVFLPSQLVAQGQHSLAVALGAASVGLVAAALAAPLMGALSDVVGRRAVLLGGAAATMMAWAPAYRSAWDGSVTSLIVANVVVGVLLVTLVLQSALSELFPVDLRATGIGATHGVASAIVGGTAPLVVAILADRLGTLDATPLYPMGWAMLAVVAAWWWPSPASDTSSGATGAIISVRPVRPTAP